MDRCGRSAVTACRGLARSCPAPSPASNKKAQGVRDNAHVAQTETVGGEPHLVGVADFEADRQGQADCAPASLGDHGGIGVDSDDPSLRPHQLGQAPHLMPEPAAHVQNLIPVPDLADIEHPPFDLLDQRAFVGAIEPAEHCLGVT